MPRSKGMVIGFWIVTAFFCLQMSFTAYAQLRFPQVSEAFTHLGFPAYFRVELSWAKPSAWCCCLRRCRRGSRSGPMPASPSTSALRSSPTSRWAMARRRGAGRRPPACSGGSRTSSGAACRPRRRAPDRAPPAVEVVGVRGGGDVGDAEPVESRGQRGDVVHQGHALREVARVRQAPRDRKSTRLNSSHGYISYAVFCLKKKTSAGSRAKARRARVIHKPQTET